MPQNVFASVSKHLNEVASHIATSTLTAERLAGHTWGKTRRNYDCCLEMSSRHEEEATESGVPWAGQHLSKSLFAHVAGQRVSETFFFIAFLASTLSLVGLLGVLADILQAEVFSDA